MIRAIGIMFICCAAAFGRTPEGPLGPLRTPNDAQPVVALQGGNIDVTAVARGEVFLVAGDARIALEPQWVEYPDGVRAQCAIPLSTAPGAYALEWSSSDETDVTNRAVYVIEDHAESYTFACIDAVALAGDEDSVANTLQTVTDASCRFAFVFASGESAQMVEALRALEAWPIPTYFVVSTAPPDAALWYGEPNLMFRYGPDAYFLLDSGKRGLGDALGYIASRYAQLRRETRSARWSVAILSNLDNRMAMRNTMTFFVDEPLHAVITNAPAAENIHWIGWHEPIPVHAPKKDGVRIFSAALKGISPRTAPRILPTGVAR